MLNNFRTCLIVPIRDSLPCPQVYVLVYHLKPLQQRWLNSINLVNVINSNNKHTIYNAFIFKFGDSVYSFIQ